MRLLFWRKYTPTKLARINKSDIAAEKAHKQNIQSIVKNREKAATLKRVLEENNITIELAKAMGHS